MRSGWVVSESKSFTIPSLPPSKNLLHTIIRRNNMPLIFKRSSTYEKWIQESLIYVPLFTPLAKSCYFKIDTTFEYPFLHKNGKMKRLDAHNFLEALCDLIAVKNGFDDSYVKFGSWEAYCSEKESVNITVSQVYEETGVTNEPSTD